MIHPQTEIQYINDAIGYGVFAKALLPQGTIVYVKDNLEICISPEEYHNHSQPMREVIEKYSYKDENGFRIISWDFAKYVNHCCNFNTISTGYGFEVAIRDIQPGEQITDEYSLFNLDKPMVVNCGEANCRKQINPEDFDNYYPEWDKLIKSALRKFHTLEQPLADFLDKDTLKALNDFRLNENAYRSVYSLRLREKIYLNQEMK